MRGCTAKSLIILSNKGWRSTHMGGNNATELISRDYIPLPLLTRSFAHLPICSFAYLPICLFAHSLLFLQFLLHNQPVFPVVIIFLPDIHRTVSLPLIQRDRPLV